ncbi:MAG: hypothetical protein H7Y17_15805 [Chlorobia bacterium]|nr:hypothetical protein [Fimbriimonadaceae bacterium]
MHTDEHSDPLVDLGYEERDINPKIIFKVSMFFFGFAFVSFALGWVILYFFGYWKSADGVNDLMSTKIPKSPNPILQTNVTAKTDIKEMRIKEREELTSTGPSTHVEGANRIPIEQAIKLAAARGAKLSSNPPIGGGITIDQGGSH